MKVALGQENIFGRIGISPVAMLEVVAVVMVMLLLMFNGGFQYSPTLLVNALNLFMFFVPISRSATLTAILKRVIA